MCWLQMTDYNNNALNKHKTGLCKVCIPGTEMAEVSMLSILCYMHYKLLLILLRGPAIIREWDRNINLNNPTLIKAVLGMTLNCIQYLTALRLEKIWLGVIFSSN